MSKGSGEDDRLTCCWRSVSRGNVCKETRKDRQACMLLTISDEASGKVVIKGILSYMIALM
jgi:hypothetical protein